MKFASDFLTQIADVRGFSTATVTTYASAIHDLEKTLGIDDPALIGLAELELYMTRKALAGAAAATRRARAHAIKSFFRYLAIHGKIPADPGTQFRPPDETGVGISVFTEEEVQSLIFFPMPPRGEWKKNRMLNPRAQEVAFLRDSALLGLAYCVGLRSGEVAGLTVGNLIHDGKGQTFISLKGKGAKVPKNFYVDRRVADLIDEYLLIRREANLDHPSLFAPATERETPSEKGIGQFRVGQILTKRLRDVGIQKKGRKITPHTFRYTRATHLYEAGLPVVEIRDFLRHKSIETTMRYIQLGSTKAIQRRAASKLPWNRPKGAK